MNAGERGHIDAVGHLIEGDWHEAGRVLEDVTIDNPRDVLALQAGHLVDFYTGQSRMLRDRIARALPDWSPDMPGYHAILAMHARSEARRVGKEGVNTGRSRWSPYN